MELVNVTISFRSGLPVWLSAQPRCLRRISKITPYSGLFFYFSLEQDFRIVVLRKSLESPLDCKEIQPVNPKGSQPWIFIGMADAEAEALALWPPDAKSQLIGKAPDAGKDWRQEEKGTTEDKMVGWYHWVDGHEFEQAPWVGDGQGVLVCCSPWGHKELDRLSNWTELKCQHLV